ncbi:putative phage tail protein [Escherichia phage EK010]|uniref:Putative phage tail protein n=1 Tax=Escherichia phage EK010 TaxID=2742112 RepID=A0A6J4EF43_9CAUD|nr:tail fiber protein [Escherichia phage EK010]UYE89918.1 tail fiber [Escherichia phage E20-1]BCG45032.1 putative phage tail protein [Escherichia phage EK010]
MSRELMPKSGIMMPHVVVTRDAAVVGVSTVDGVAGAIDLTDKYLQKSDASATYMTKTEGATKQYVTNAIDPVMEGALFKADPFVANDVPFRSEGANGVESVDMIKVTPENAIKIGSYASSVQGVEVHSAGRLQVVDLNDGGIETKYPIYSKRYRPEIEDLPFASIGSYVKDSKGRTIGVTRTGINSDIKQFTEKVTFQQPVTVADAVGDYDAVTLRQLRNSGGGSGGPTMNGISNFNIGDFRLIDSRAYIPSNDIPSDGQLLSRTDYPELWAYAQMITPISDADWLADPLKRSQYSLGDGSTTFRVPDKNGVQPGSIKGLYGRGSGDFTRKIHEAAAPNITGQWQSYAYNNAQQGGAVYFPTPVAQGVLNLTTPEAGTRYISFRLDASRSSPVYGKDDVSEVRTNSFIGVWVIRAKGAFVAANTSWSVINSDANRPAGGTRVTSGSVVAEYKIGSEVEASTTLQTDAYIDGVYYGIIGVYNKTKGVTKQLAFDDSGTLNSDRYAARSRTLMSWNETGIRRGTFSIDNQGIGANYSFNSILSASQASQGGYKTTTHVGMIHNDAGSFADSCWHVSGDENNQFGCRLTLRPNRNEIFYYTWQPGSAGTYTLAMNPVSDERLKHNIQDISPDEAIRAIKGLDFKSFVYNNDNQGRTRRGIIAQQAEKVEPLYVKTRKFHDNDGVEQEQKELDATPMLLDTMQVVQDLLKRIEVLEAKLAEK